MGPQFLCAISQRVYGHGKKNGGTMHKISLDKEMEADSVCHAGDCNFRFFCFSREAGLVANGTQVPNASPSFVADMVVQKKRTGRLTGSHD